MQDYKCVHCNEMYETAQEWLDHCQRHHRDGDLKVFVRHVSFTERSLARRPMFVMKNFHIKVRDLDTSRSRIDSDLRLRSLDEPSPPPLPPTPPPVDLDPSVRRQAFRRTSRQRPLTLPGRSASLDTGTLQSYAPSKWPLSRDDACVPDAAPWWQESGTTLRGPPGSGSGTIHRGTGSLTVKLSTSTPSLAENTTLTLADTSPDGGDDPGSDDKHGDLSDSLDLSRLEIHPQNNSSAKSEPESDHHEHSTNGISGSRPEEHTSLMAAPSSQVDSNNHHRQAAFSVRSPYLRSHHGLDANHRQRRRQTAIGVPYESARDLGAAPRTRAPTSGLADRSADGNGGSLAGNGLSLPVTSQEEEEERCQSLPTAVGRPVERQPSGNRLDDDGVTTTSTTAKVTNGNSAEKVAAWINQSHFSVDDTTTRRDSYSSPQTADPGFINTIYTKEAMGTSYSHHISDSLRRSSHRQTPGTPPAGAVNGTRRVQGVRDISKVNNRYSTGALIDHVHGPASWALPDAQSGLGAPNARRAPRHAPLHPRAQDDINIPKMSKLSPVEAFRKFCSADSFDDAVKSYEALCIAIGLRETDRRDNSYGEIRRRVNCPEASKFYRLLDARLGHEVYGNRQIGKGTTVLVIGGGPCGLRTAIECALFGARVVVLEMRNYATRNNVLHLWPFAANDIKSIGAKVFYPKFCAGAIHHVSIRRLQLILMKTALILGVEIHSPVKFEELIQPSAAKGGTGWRAKVSPASCPVNNLEFQVLVGADGKRNSLDFPRKFTRGKVSIAITANFKNSGGGLHTRVSEIPGVISVKRPELFTELKKKTGMDFENFVYFRDETHYFIMTARKKSIIEQGIVKRETADLRAMFHPNNLNKDKLLKSVRDIAETAWKVDNPSFTELPELDFQLDRYGNEDVAIFDFAALHQAEHACMVKERNGHKLFMCVVGDTLLEPFWPTGSGIAKGFLGCLDTAMAIRNWSHKQMSDLEVIAGRESVFRVLPQVAPESLQKGSGTIDPKSRYGSTQFSGRLPLNTVGTKDVQHLLNTCDAVKRKSCGITFQELPKEKRRLYRGGSIDTHRLVSWYKEKLSRFGPVVKVTDLTKSWNDGLALCALVQMERPDLIDVSCLDRNDCMGNIQKAFTLIEDEFGVEQMMSPEDLARRDDPDRLTMMSYLFHIYEYIMTKDDSSYPIITKVESDVEPKDPSLPSKSSAFRLLKTIANSNILLRTLQSDAKRIRELDVDSLARKAESRGGGPAGNMDYFLKTASLDRRAKSKVHMAVRRTKTIKADQVARKWRKKTQEHKQRKLSAAEDPAVQVRDAEQKENRKPQPDLSNTLTREDTLKSGEQNMDSAGRRRGVMFTEDTKAADGPSEEATIADEEEKRRMMSLPRQACGGVASSRIQAFQARENKEQQISSTPSKFDQVDYSRVSEQMDTDEPHPISRAAIPRRDAFRGARDLSDEDRNAPKRRSAFRSKSNSQVSQEESTPGNNTLKRTGEICCICNKKLYLVERFNAQGFFLHRHCFKCHHCNTHLRVGNYIKLEDPQGNPRFFCFAHAYQSGAFDVQWNGASSEDADAKDDDTLKKSDEGIGNEFRGPLTEEELKYLGDVYDDDDTDEDDEDIDDAYDANVREVSDPYGSLSLQSILSDLDQKCKAQGADGGTGDLDDLGSDVTDTSSQLLQQEDIQQGLEDLETERSQLEEQGVELEQKIRGERDTESARTEDDMMNDWLELARKKQELNERESKLMLKLRLMGLQERLRAMLEMMPVNSDEETGALEAKVEKMEAVTDEMERAALKEDLSEMTHQMRRMKSFLNNSQC